MTDIEKVLFEIERRIADIMPYVEKFGFPRDKAVLSTLNGLKTFINNIDKEPQDSVRRDAEEAALKAYPDGESPDWDNKPKIYVTQMAERAAFVNGYEQGKKDSELDWQDIEKIIDLRDEIDCEVCNGRFRVSEKDQFCEVARLFNNFKKK